MDIPEKRRAIAVDPASIPNAIEQAVAKTANIAESQATEKITQMK